MVGKCREERTKGKREQNSTKGKQIELILRCMFVKSKLEMKGPDNGGKYGWAGERMREREWERQIK